MLLIVLCFKLDFIELIHSHSLVLEMVNNATIV